MRVVIASFVVSGALFAPSLAASQAPTAMLEVTHDAASERCLDREDLVLRVAGRLGRDPFVEEALMRFRIRTTRDAHGYLAVLEMLDGSGSSLGSRDWRRPRCDTSLSAEVALALTLLIREAPDPEAPPSDSDPLVEAIPEPVEPDVEAPLVAEPVTPPVAEPVPVPAPTVQSPSTAGPGIAIRFELTAFGSVLFDVAPAPAGGLGLGVGVRIGEVVSMGFEGRFDIPVSAPLRDGGRAETSVAMGGAYVCGRFLYVGGCAVGFGGALRATGQDLSVAATATTPYATIGARVFGEVVFDPVVIHLRFDVLPAIVRTSLQVSGETVWALPPVSFALGAGVGAIF